MNVKEKLMNFQRSLQIATIRENACNMLMDDKIPDNIKLEITKTLEILNNEGATKAINRLKEVNLYDYVMGYVVTENYLK